jgi:hypothetical protein
MSSGFHPFSSFTVPQRRSQHAAAGAGVAAAASDGMGAPALCSLPSRRGDVLLKAGGG